MDHLTVTILAAGEGKRMNSNVPKVLHLLKNRPMVVRVIETARKLRPHKIIVVTGKHDELIQRTISKYTFIKDITFVKQALPLGTGNAIKTCFSEYEDEGPVLILNGDMPLINDKILNRMIQSITDATVLTAKFEDPTGYGRIISDAYGDLIKIVEEKDCSEEEKQVKIINTGVYKVHSHILKEFITKIDNDNSQKEYYLTDIVRLLKNRFIPVDTILVDERENIFVSGANTQEELLALVPYAA
jgi:bifunctional UDP-N-acetylglucosamine pyrophosphorylase/glucosamine-1-phosphate N-acetyltransferase